MSGAESRTGQRRSGRERQRPKRESAATAPRKHHSRRASASLTAEGHCELMLSRDFIRRKPYSSSPRHPSRRASAASMLPAALVRRGRGRNRRATPILRQRDPERGRLVLMKLPAACCVPTRAFLLIVIACCCIPLLLLLLLRRTFDF